MQKLIIIEPDLKNTNGHVYEAMRAIDRYLLSHKKKFNYYLVSHKKINSLTRASFRKILPYAEVSCFETLNHLKTTDYLMKTLLNLKALKEDIVIFPTAHLNELKAVAKIYNEEYSPSFILQLHQFYPPLSDSDKINTNRNIAFLNNAFKNVFYKLNNGKRIKIVTTPVVALNKKLSRLSPFKLGRFPVPFIFPKLRSTTRNRDNFTVGFFGDGRKEKGLLKFLEAVSLIIKKLPKLKILIQIQNPRCFTKKEANRITFLVNSLKKIPNIKFITGVLNSKDYHEYLTKCSAIVIPYDPRHYRIRMSGIAIECGALGIPVITTRHTWAGNMVGANRISGTTFSFTSNQELFEKRLNKAIDKILKNMIIYQKMARKHRKFYRDNFSAENYFKNFILKN